MSRKSDRVMSFKLGLVETVVNIICAYSPQVGCTEEEKQMDQDLSATLEGERIIVGVGLSGHTGSSREGD